MNDHDGVSRRDLVRLGLFAGGAGLVTAGAIAVAGPNGARAVAAPSRGVPATGGRTGAALAEHTPATREPRWLHTWRYPISSLDDFERRSGTRFARKAIMLTIDDGPDAEWTPKYLRLLARHHVTATFNMIGEQVHSQARLVRAVASEGHHIGNHTFTHPLDLPYLSARKIRHELENTTDAIVRASGFRPRQFRAPGGVWGPDVFAEASRQGMAPLGWDIDPRDWALPGVDEIRSAMLASRPHDIILCHDGGGDRHETYEALRTVIPAILARGWTFVTLPAPPTV